MKPSLFIGPTTHSELIALLRDRQELTVSGASNETAKAMLLSHILHLEPRSAVVVTEDETRVEGLVHWLQFFEQKTDVIHFPEEEVTADHIASLVHLFHGGGVSLIEKGLWERELPLFSEMEERAIELKVGQKIDFTDLFSQLIDCGYSHGNDPYLSTGEYRRTGDTLDIYPVGADHSFRIQFAFDTVEKISKVDRYNLGITADHEGTIVLYPLTWTKTAPLARQFPKNKLLVLDDQDEIESLKGVDTLHFTSFPQSEEGHVHVRYLSVLKFYTLPDFINDVKDKLHQEWSLIIVTKRAVELEAILTEEKVQFLTGERRKGAITIVPADKDALLPHSLQNPDLKCALITDREIFSLKKENKQRSVQRLALDFITSLQVGDFVVHMEHGIGCFEGMTQKEVDGLAREYLEITYAENDKLFVPVDQADKLSKFVHEEGDEPVLTRLGAADWKRITKKISEETQRIAKELLEIYAKRAKAKGHRYGDDTEAQKKFDEAFPYEETPGQMKAIEDLKRDMEGDHPMDRLVCGDVGFGKTEVAMRAAFKAVQGGKQVALLSPITILADQHYKSLLERMKGFNIRIDMLSRFRSKQEQAVVLEKLRKGDLDIVVGTHRLLQEDVKFFNLGLVIIDEEQRFGVKQKEIMKSMRAAVDILTLTATPIPRTLNLGLHKLRDITIITTPPPGRLPIITEVRKYSDSLIREAIQKELARKGQVYVLHNRVQTIDAFAMKLRALVPEAKFVVTHGQLKPELLEERIMAFKEGKFDVLVSSTIIENGIDLARANTLIVNEAEKFGLSQLYQLRGRVGRGPIQAYSYFLYHSQRLKDDAKKRLRAIVEASELGSGFQIAMRDLEIRGSGEILGANQSGNMQTVGVSHYLRMLKSAVEELKAGGKVEEEVQNIEIILPFEALIPSFYIPEEQEKIGIYQKLAGAEDEAILAEFENDLLEEYGKLPQQVIHLLNIIRLKMACRRSGVTRVKSDEVSKGKREVVLTLNPRVTAAEIMQLLQVNPQWRISSQTLRINEADLIRKAGTKDYLPELTVEIAALQKKSQKEKKLVEAKVVAE